MGKLLGLKDAEDLFAAALLQDMAVPLLAKELPEQYKKLLEDRSQGTVRLSDLEQAQFGWTHAQAAGQMARSWSLPEEFAVYIEAHTRLDQFLPDVKKQPGAVAVGLSSLLPPVNDGQWVDRERFLQIYQQITPPGGCSIEELLKKVDDGFAEFAPVLKLAVPKKTLVETIAQAPVQVA
jgi:hypothetical protein